MTNHESALLFDAGGTPVLESAVTLTIRFCGPPACDKVGPV